MTNENSSEETSNGIVGWSCDMYLQGVSDQESLKFGDVAAGDDADKMLP